MRWGYWNWICFW